MHTLNRILTCLLMFAVLIPPATFALISLDEKFEAQEHLQEAIGSAAGTYQARSYLQSSKTKNEKVIRDAESRMASLERRKFEVRQAVIKERRIIATIGEKYGVTLESRDQVKVMVETEKRRLSRLFRDRSVRQASDPFDPRMIVLRTAFRVATGETTDAVLESAQTRLMRDLSAADKAFARLEAAEDVRNAVLAEYNQASGQRATAVQAVERSTDALTEIVAIMDDVHAQVLKLQGELARIDARLKEKAERALIEKGLLKAEDIGKADPNFRQQFSWPVYGRISAGFKNAAYHKHFGVPHYGMDIVVGQESPVAAAADGVVFLVRDGGAKGYSYILIGHRGGYATLYGHMFKALVKTGEDVTAGQIIGLSGGTPGTHGAGPMTTAAHLHFEVIQNGENVDPATVLP